MINTTGYTTSAPAARSTSRAVWAYVITTAAIGLAVGFVCVVLPVLVK